MNWKSHSLKLHHLSHVLSPIPWPTHTWKIASNTITYPTTASIKLPQEHTSKTMSRKRPSISLIHKRSLDFIWPIKISIDISQEKILWLLSHFRIGTLAGINRTICHRPADQNCYEIKKGGIIMKNNQMKKNNVEPVKIK